ncbi:J domain-containing protein [Sphingomonas sp. Leaf25]|uniref:J domain-containing protein n=1 Tax=Sphingomonas sp. Leaf25 TaxID=1735692 RepID=UPI0006F82B67|nr:J domain-containing protein [Sphingomonas sp. Leaf25]KQN07175.1 molecular chaperone DnaJ [Sphingomonas sp. Leaf25]
MAREKISKERPGARFHGRVEADGRRCEAPGCDEAGEFRAPRRDGGRQGDGPGGYRWFCLEHVRAFNAGYNYFAGMTVEEIHDAQRPYAGWERETRAFAHAGADPAPAWADFADPLEAIGATIRDRAAERAAARAERQDGRPLTSLDRSALKVMGLAVDADRSALRKRYSELVRRYHPDRNGGDRAHEAALQKVIAAYQQLRTSRAFA